MGPAPAAVTVVDDLVFPEGPRWHDGRLWFSDIHANRVVTFDADRGAQTFAELDQPSGLGFLPDGTLLAASMRDKTVCKVFGNRTLVHADLSDWPGDFLNDMIVDGDGRAYVGCRHHRGPGLDPPPDCVVAVEPDGSCGLAAGELIGPNGTVIDPSGSTLLVAETHAFRITAFHRSSDGRLSGRRTFAQFPEGQHPDGMCLDAQGALWVATGSSGEALRIADGGQILDRRAVPDRWLTACVLGGPLRRTLFVTTAATTVDDLMAVMAAKPGDHDDHRRWARSRSHGRIEALGVEVAGVGLP